jgi:CheY-like chemotaxis protein/anti-sigma regulatory factor (Ser/Thr protein kinase)
VRPAAATVWADEDKVQQALINLLSNAVKFSPAGGTVTLAAERDGEDLRFSVADRGRGIPPEKVDTIFERFVQVDPSDSREKGGTGLGLSIVRSIVELHGGRVWVESEAGAGSTFAFTLRASATEGEAPQSAPFVVVLAADPAAEARALDLAAGAGCRASVADAGSDPVQTVLDAQPDAVLVDAGRDREWRALHRLREHPEARLIPVLALDGPNGDAATPPSLEAAIRLLSLTTVVVVEDDVDLARVLESMFASHGVATHVVASGEEALELLGRVTPDLLVLDLMLPERDGFDVVEVLRRQGRLADVPMLVYTALDLAAEERDRLRLGPTEYLTKSRVSPHEFERRALELLRRVVADR